MGNFIKLAAVALALGGCATPEQQAARMQTEMARMMTVYGPACNRLGYQNNSDPWRHCVLQLSAKEEMERYGSPHYSAFYGRGHWGWGGRWGP